MPVPHVAEDRQWYDCDSVPVPHVAEGEVTGQLLYIFYACNFKSSRQAEAESNL